MRPDLKNIHQEISQLMPAVNRLLVKKFVLPKKISYKSGGIDHLGISVVTETDKEVENILRKKLTRILPGSGFIGEETPLEPKEYNWVVDPIDGTLNFASQVPVFACSIGLWHKNTPVYAYVSLPFSAETLHAFAGQGIYLNGQFIKPQPSQRQKLFIAFATVGDKDLIKNTVNAVLQFTSSPRSYGSSVFHGAQIALGRIDAGVFTNQALWDIGAITLLATEAGLSVKYISKEPDIVGDNLKQYQYSLVIGQKKLAEDLAAALQ
jgi:fructose-1,6-bisphosphatase/inositol monophosphatase family enzyme